MEFAARFNRPDAAVQLATGHKISGQAKNAEAAKSGLARPHDDAWWTLLTWWHRSGVGDQWRWCSSGRWQEDGSTIKNGPGSESGWWCRISGSGRWMHILPKVKTQRQMAGQMTMSVWHQLTQRHRRYQSDAHNQLSRRRRRKIAQVGATKAACVDAAAAYVDVARITLTEGGRTRWGIPNNSRSVRLFFFNVVKEDIICKKISVIDSVYNHTITLECELKVVSKMPSMKRPTAVFAKTAVTISKQIPLEATWFPMWNRWILKENRRHVMLFLQAVGQRSQLIPEVLDMINETWTKFRGEEFVPSRLADKESWPTKMFVLNKTKQTGILLTYKAFPSLGSAEREKSTAELDAARTTAKHSGHAVEIVKVCLRRGAQCLSWFEKSCRDLTSFKEGIVDLNWWGRTSSLEKHRAFAISTGNDTHRSLESDSRRILDAECHIGFDL